jgi:hypothetical protein
MNEEKIKFKDKQMIVEVEKKKRRNNYEKKRNFRISSYKNTFDVSSMVNILIRG